MRTQRPHVDALDQQYDWSSKEGWITVGSRRLALDLANRHERYYYLHAHADCVAPGIELDLRLFERFVRPGDDVLDAGANIGFTACTLLQYGAARVAAIEPEPRLAARLQALTGPDIELHAVALGGSDGEAELTLSETHNQGHTLSAGMRELFPAVFAEGHSVRVPVRRLDTLFPDRRFDVWKIDIEGVEPECLDGAEAHLAGQPPRAVLIEIYPPTFAATMNRLQRHFPVIRRAALGREAGDLVFLEPVPEALGDAFWPAPPTFVASFSGA